MSNIIDSITGIKPAPKWRRRKFVFRGIEARRGDVMAFYGNGASVRPLAFSSTIKDMKALLHNA